MMNTDHKDLDEIIMMLCKLNQDQTFVDAIQEIDKYDSEYFIGDIFENKDGDKFALIFDGLFPIVYMIHSKLDYELIACDTNTEQEMIHLLDCLLDDEVKIVREFAQMILYTQERLN